MERSEQFQAASICSELNLRIDDLNVQDLLNNVIYRRLYNIVVHDTNKTQYQYRKNLIKQLYFLLKITPIMKPELQNSYLEKLESWYNNNDHKKTQLGSGRLKNIVDEYVTTKQNFGCQNDQTQARPQSGVNWNKNVVPFLRPYTSKRPANYQTRPESYKSKFGQSTKASTRMQSSTELAIRDFALSIKEQLQVSQDFINKNRTIHPQSEPIYEQLFSIISKAGVGSRIIRDEHEDDENEILFQRDKQQFYNSPDKEAKNVEPEEDKLQKDSLLGNDQLDDFDKVSQESEKDEDDEKQEDKVETNLERKAFTRDLNQTTNNTNPIQGFLHLQNQNHNDTLLLKKLNNKYTHITNNKFVAYSKDDHQMVRNYLDYSRVKSAMKKEFNRKSQSKRLLSAKCRSTTNLSTVPQKNLRIYSATPKRHQSSIGRNSDKLSINVNGAQYFDLSRISVDKQNTKTFIPSPNYNQRQELNKIYRRPIQQYKKMNKTSISMTEIKNKDKNFMTKYDCFLTRQKINPIADVHVQKHNEQALEQIEKIKEKVAGLSRMNLSTDSLMKALYINSYDDIGSCKQINNFLINDSSNSPLDQKVNDAFDWRKRDVCFNLLSNGQKKMKKKTRKLVKK